MSTTIELYSGDRDDFALFATIGSEEGTAVVSVSGADVTLPGDFSSSVSAGESVVLQDHPAAGEYEVASVAYDSKSDETTITLTETLNGESAEGYLLLPWNVRGDFDTIRAEMKVAIGFDPVVTWDIGDNSLSVEDGRGTGDKMRFEVLPTDTESLGDLTYQMDVQGKAGSDTVTIIKKGDIEISVSSDITA